MNELKHGSNGGIKYAAALELNLYQESKSVSTIEDKTDCSIPSTYTIYF